MTYVTTDSGAVSEHDDGMRRDAVTGKPTFGLMFPRGVPYEEQLITRVAALYERGGRKYGARNWELSCTEDSLAHHEESFLRHVMEFYCGVQDGEDHAAAVVWNVNAILLTRRNIAMRQQRRPGTQGAHYAFCPATNGHRPGACTCPWRGDGDGGRQ